MKEQIAGSLIFAVPAVIAVLLTLKLRASFLVGWAVYLAGCVILFGVADRLVFNPWDPASTGLFKVSWLLVLALVLFFLPVALIYAAMKEGFTVAGVGMFSVAIFLLGILALVALLAFAGVSV